MTDYEVTYILRPSLEESEVEERANAVAEIVKGQVKKLRDDGNAEVAFRVAVKDGKVAFTARALKGAKKSKGER